MPTRTVKLTGRRNAYIEQAVACGRYPDGGDVIREGLRLLALREWEDGTAPAPVPTGAIAAALPALVPSPTDRRAAFRTRHGVADWPAREPDPAPPGWRGAPAAERRPAGWHTLPAHG